MVVPLSLTISNPKSRSFFIHSRFVPPFSFSSIHLTPRAISLKPTSKTQTRFSNLSLSAYVSGPASDYVVTEPDPNVNGFPTQNSLPKDAVNWGLMWSLLLDHKWRVALCAFALLGCSTCTLCMPLFSGRFFEVLSGARPEPLWKLMSKIAVLYALEPIFTVIFVVNMTKIWEKVMSVLRAHIFKRMLIQKVEFFDRYKVGELTGLLTSDLGSLKNIVSENVSRDRGFRALSEVVGTMCILFALSPQLAPVLGLLMLMVSISVAVYKRSTIPVFKAHGLAQSSMSDSVTETISAIRTVRSFGGERRQMSAFARQILGYQASGVKLGTYKSLNESVTRIAVYVSLLALYCLGGSKVKAGELSVGTVVSFIGYTFTLTFSVQGLVYTFGDLRQSFAAIERINSILSASEVDEALAYGLERQTQPKDVQDEKLKLYAVNGLDEKLTSNHVRYMSALGSSSDICSLAWSGDICLEG